MRTKIAILAVLFLLSACAVTAGTVTVTWPGSIQAAIDAASPGDTVEVGPGTYTEQIVINKGIGLEGAGIGSSVIMGTGVDGPTVKIVPAAGTGDVTFTGFTVQTVDSSDTQTDKVRIFVGGGTASQTVTITSNEFLGTGVAANENDYGLIAQNGEASIVFTYNKLSDIGGNVFLIERYDGATDVSFNTVDTGLGGGDTYYSMTYDGKDITAPQRVCYNMINLATGPSDASNKITAISFSGAWKAYFWGLSSDSGRYSDVEIKGNIITGFAPYRRGIAIDNFGATGAAGEFTNLRIEDNVLVGGSSADAATCGIRLSGLMDSPSVRHNKITNLNTDILVCKDFTTGSHYPVDTVCDHNYLADSAVLLNWAGDGSFNAENNWWGSAAGPAAGEVLGTVDYAPWLQAAAVLKLQADKRYVKLGDPVTVVLKQSELAFASAGYQSFLSFGDGNLGLTASDIVLSGDYGQMLAKSVSGGAVSLAAGVDPGVQTPTGADADVATMTFQTVAEGTTSVAFRTDGPQTKFSDAYGDPVVPQMIPTDSITVDGSGPVITPPADISRNNDPGACGASIVIGQATASDTLSGVQSLDAYIDGSKVDDPASARNFPCGATTVTWKAVDNAGNESSVDQTVTVTDNEAPVIAVPTVDPVYADPNLSSAVINWTITAQDNCDGPVAVTCDPPSGSRFDVGTHTINCTAKDSKDNTATTTFTVTVLPYNQAAVTVELEGVAFANGVTSITRCIEFNFGAADGSVHTVSTPVEFTMVSGKAAGEATISTLPAGTAWDCVTAKDELHTLQSKVSLGITGGQYAASFTGADVLMGGDLTNDNVVDVLDFGVFVGRYGRTESADTLCGYPGRHADISGDGFVGTEDFLFIQQHFLTFGRIACGLAGAAAAGVGRTSIPVKGLAKIIGMKSARKADINKDGVVDTTDVKLFAQGKGK